MNGNVYTGVVVETTHVLLTKGASATTLQSKIVLDVTKPFIATSMENARALVLAEAIAQDLVDLNDVTRLVDVKVYEFK